MCSGMKILLEGKPVYWSPYTTVSTKKINESNKRSTHDKDYIW